MKKIRKGVFETNSSSTHSFTIAGDFKKADKTLYTVDGVCEVYPGEFGWGHETYNDSATKASYCLTYVKACGAGKYEDLLKRVISEVTGAKEVKFIESGCEYHPWGYIDHQSWEDGQLEEIFSSEKNLKNFIFNTASYLETDNDNH